MVFWKVLFLSVVMLVFSIGFRVSFLGAFASELLLVSSEFSFRGVLASGVRERILVEISDLTYRYYRALSGGNVSVIDSMLYKEFVLDGVVHFYDRKEAVSFLASVYGSSIGSFEFSSVEILSYGDYLKSNLYESEGYSGLRDYFASGEYVAFVPDMRVDGVIVLSRVYLVFVRDGGLWYIKGMYNN